MDSNTSVPFRPAARPGGGAKVLKGSVALVQQPALADAGSQAEEVTFGQAWMLTARLIREHLMVWEGDKRIEPLGSWSFSLGMFVKGICAAKFDSSSQRHFQEVVDALLDPQDGLTGMMTAFRALKSAERLQKADEYLKRFEACIPIIVEKMGTLIGVCSEAGERERAKAAFKILAGKLQLASASDDSGQCITLKVFQSTETREISVKSITRAGALKKFLVDKKGFPSSIKLLSRSNSTIFTMKASDKLPEDGVVLVHGTESLHPAFKLTSLPGHRSQEEQAWAFGGLIPRLTNEKALQMFHELREGFQTESFRKELEALWAAQRARRAAKGRGEQTSDKYSSARPSLLELVFGVQREVIPKYGFEPTMEGVAAMRAETTEIMTVYPPLLNEHYAINKELGLSDESKIHDTQILHSPRFEANDEDAWKAYLAANGFVVIAGVCTDIAHCWDLLWEFIETSDASGSVQRSDVNSWQHSNAKDCGWPAGREDGIIHTRGIGQSPLLWYLRSLVSLKNVFGRIWKTDKLITSFDGAGTFRPFGRNESWKTTKKSWHHVDQAHTKPGLHCIQGQVTLTDVSESSGGLVVVPGSHRFHNELLRTYEHSDWDFISLKKDDPIITEGGGGPRLVAAQAGDLILWDSRTVHCNTLPLKDDAIQYGHSLIRVTAYICMTPAEWCDSATLEKRQDAFERQVTTSHWPHDYHEMNRPEQPRRNNFKLTEAQTELLGSLAPPSSAAAPSQASGLSRGLPSFLPQCKFQVISSTGVDVRRLPTCHWGGDPVGQILPGDVVQGYRFGNWLRLAEWDARFSVRDASGETVEMGKATGKVPEERWVQIRQPPDAGFPQLVETT